MISFYSYIRVIHPGYPPFRHFWKRNGEVNWGISDISSTVLQLTKLSSFLLFQLWTSIIFFLFYNFQEGNTFYRKTFWYLYFWNYQLQKYRNYCFCKKYYNYSLCFSFLNILEIVTIEKKSYCGSKLEQ